MKNKEFLQKVQQVYEDCFLRLKAIIDNDNFMQASEHIEGYECTKDVKIAIDMYMNDCTNETIYTSYPELLDILPNSDEINEYWKKMNISDDDFDEIRNYNIYYNILKEIISTKFINLDFCYDKNDFELFVSSDFYCILEYQVHKVLSKELVYCPFLEKQLDVYAKGGFPYGWKGDYPNGNILVYLPI